jgi:hypothetical protein
MPISHQILCYLFLVDRDQVRPERRYVTKSGNSFLGNKNIICRINPAAQFFLLLGLQLPPRATRLEGGLRSQWVKPFHLSQEHIYSILIEQEPVHKEPPPETIPHWQSPPPQILLTGTCQSSLIPSRSYTDQVKGVTFVCQWAPSEGQGSLFLFVGVKCPEKVHHIAIHLPRNRKHAM